MGTPAIAIFCKHGHVARVIKRDEIEGPGITRCRYCGSTEFALQVGWGDDGYESVVPREQLGFEYIKDKKVYVFDVSGVTEWCRLTPNVLRICKDCKEEFLMRGGEIDFFLQANLTLPKRCPKCRKERRESKNKYAETKEKVVT